ncbi:NAD(P)/FAD-dependent oxidoreductase [Tenacibaculum retecalamus]|uniref:NAD(P)/FAD-dependent oxidoreductase n=1 Tax=Tenacibaculum retecalamus TaxID=3018315 RepID=UPI0023D9468C|nr:FAD-dependent oxidoreductase [Tenacibaculum retecalamus]WBX71670.1 FAD-dependent oxidoreductase [Tenacibaculum retecalamus]
MSKKVLIIGGGIIGLCTAYYLQKKGNKVTIIDKSDFTSGASYVNAGFITPSHIISLAAPGMINKGIKWMLNPESPFYVKPRLDYDFLKWSWLFKKASTTQKVESAIKVIKDINLLSKNLYEDIKASNDFDFFYQHKGLLMCYQTDKAGEEEWTTGQRGIKEGLHVENLTKKQVLKLEPDAGLNIKGAVYYHSDAHMTPNEFMPQLKNYLVKNNVTILANEEVLDMNLLGDKVSSIKTDKQELFADEIIVATGSWSQKLLKKLNTTIPVQAGKGYRINVSKKTGITIPAILIEAKVAVTPMNGFTRFAGTMEVDTINHTINTRRVDAIAKAGEKYYDRLKIEQHDIDNAACGLRPCSPDGLPYIGRLSKVKNVTIATGHAMMGWSLGPATGKLVSEIISEEKTSLNITPFNPNRFD